MSIRIAFIGFGRRAKTLYGCIRRFKGVDVVAIFDVVSKADYPAPYFRNINQMFNVATPDLVIIATPPKYHIKYILVCQKHNVPAVCEKPVALSVRDLKTLKSVKVKVYAAYQLPFDTLINKAFSLVKSSKIKRITASQRVNLNEPGWRDQIDLSGGGTLFDNGSHLIHLVLSQYGMPQKVFGSMGAKSGSVGEHQADCSLFYRDFIVHIYTDWLSAIGKENRIDILTNDRDINYLDQNGQTQLHELHNLKNQGWSELINVNFTTPKGLQRSLANDPYNLDGRKDANECMLEAFIADLPHGKLAIISKQLATDTVRVIHAVYQSARQKEIVKL